MFNHYARLKTLIEANPDYQILLINKPTKTKGFNGEYNYYDHYYRLITQDGRIIKYGKFQQLDKLAKILDVDIHKLESKIIYDNIK